MYLCTYADHKTTNNESIEHGYCLYIYNIDDTICNYIADNKVLLNKKILFII